MTQNLVTPENVAEALSNSKRFPEGSPQFQAFAPFVGQLVEIVSSDRFEKLVNVADLCDVMAQFLDWLGNNEDFEEKIGETIGNLHAGLLTTLYVQMAESAKLIAMSGISEAKLVKKLGLRRTGRKLYSKGKLSFAALLLDSPEIFIPESKHK
jgi:hypothetical protein